jgi:hypothetical protein
VSRQLQRAVEQYVASGGNPDVVPTDLPGSQRPHGEAAGPEAVRDDISGEGAAIDPEARWLDRAAAVIEERLGGLGNGYLEALVSRFDHHMAHDPPPAPGKVP